MTGTAREGVSQKPIEFLLFGNFGPEPRARLMIHFLLKIHHWTNYSRNFSSRQDTIAEGDVHVR